MVIFHLNHRVYYFQPTVWSGNSTQGLTLSNVIYIMYDVRDTSLIDLGW